jgi:hypothetical protein
MCTRPILVHGGPSGITPNGRLWHRISSGSGELALLQPVRQVCTGTATGEPMLGRKVAGKSQRELHELGLLAAAWQN